MKVHLLNRVENSVTKGEIARFEQFIILSQCFQESAAAEASESVCMSERVMPGHTQSVYHHHID